MPAATRYKRILVASLIFGLLLGLLFQYRILSLLNKMGADVTPIGTKLPITFDFEHSPEWLLPVFYALDYVNSIWFNTLLALFIAGAMMVFLPGLTSISLRGRGFGPHFAGVAMGIPNMFCTCCAVGAFTGLRRAGAGLGASLSFFLTAPALNIVVLILAFEMLPAKLAIARLILGLAAAIGVSYGAARLGPNDPEQVKSPQFHHDQSVHSMLTSWIGYTWQVTKTVLPTLVVAFLIVGVFQTFFPFESIARRFGNDLSSTVTASVIGTFLMAPTFAEVLWVGEMTKHGMGTGPAVALLITLPVVSFPSLWVLGRVLRSTKIAVCLGASIMLLGILGGIVFSAF